MKQKLLINEAKNLVLLIRYLSISQKSRKTNALTVDQWCLQQKGREGGDSRKRRGKPSGETLQARVSEIRHRANFPKAERWLSLAAYTANRSQGSNLAPPIAHHLPRGNCHPERQQQRCCPSQFTICILLFFFFFSRWKSAKTPCPIAHCFTPAVRSSIKTLLSFNISKREKLA